MDELNDLDKKLLDTILVKSPGELTDEEKGIVMARREYLDRRAMSKFGKMIKEIEGVREAEAKKEAEKAKK